MVSNEQSAVCGGGANFGPGPNKAPHRVRSSVGRPVEVGRSVGRWGQIMSARGTRSSSSFSSSSVIIAGGASEQPTLIGDEEEARTEFAL